MPIAPFGQGRGWILRASAIVNRRVWYDPSTGHEYEKCTKRGARTWHEIDPIRKLYRDVDPVTGVPVPGGWGQWRPAR